MKVKRVFVSCGVVLASLLMGNMVVGGVYANLSHEAHSDVQFTFHPIIGLTLSSTSADCPSPYQPNSTFCIFGLTAGNIGISNTVTASVKTNSSAGYTLSATAGGNSIDGTTNFTDNKLTLKGASGTTLGVFDMIPDGSSTLSPGEWGYTVDGGTTYGSIPYVLDSTKTPAIINKTINNVGTPATGYNGTANTNIQIGAYAGSLQNGGAYKNVINLTATANVQTRIITLEKYNSDVATVNITSLDGQPITPTTTGSYTEGQVIGIEAVCAGGAKFYGWGLSGDFGQFADQNSAITTYMIGESNVVITAYCGGSTMQDVTADACTATPKAVIDSRDNQRYTIQRLNDGECWMIENLRLGYNENNAASSSYITTLTLNPASSDVNQTRTIRVYDFKEYGDSYEQCHVDGNPAAGLSGLGMENPCMRSYSSESPTPATGVWYNYAAASAGTITGDSNTDIATESICPGGWTLPNSTQIINLASALGGDPSSFGPIAGGAYYNGILYSYGDFGSWWSTAPASAEWRETLDYEGGDLWGDGQGSRAFGFFVRCVLK